MFIKYTISNHDTDNLVLPYSYEGYLQALLYKLNSSDFGAFLHDEGYRFENRTYKMFTFSQFLEKPEKVLKSSKEFVFPNKVSFIVATVENAMLDALYGAITSGETFRLGKYSMQIEEVSVMEPAHVTDLLVEAKSPVCTYTTMLKPDGGKYTKYWSPQEKEFEEQVRQNAIHKYMAYYGKEPINKELSVKAIGRTQERKSLYKKEIIVGYMGRFRLTGSPELIEIIQNSGMGAKNAQGKGLVIPIESYEQGD